MSFEEIINMMENATDYMDLYDAVSYIVDDNLRTDVEQLIEQCEIDGDSVEIAYSLVTSDLLNTKICDLNESLKFNKDELKDCNMERYIEYIDDASNDKDLVDIINMMYKNKNISKDLVDNIHQLFKNNRYIQLNQKVDTIIKYINDNMESNNKSTNDNMESNNKSTNTSAYESKKITEAVDNVVDSEIKIEDNIEKQNDSINDKIDVNNNYKSIIEVISNRIGQKFNVGEFNSVLQSIFGQYNKVFLLTSDLYNMDLDKTQYIEVTDDDINYVISFDIVDMDSGLIELKDIELKEV